MPQLKYTKSNYIKSHVRDCAWSCSQVLVLALGFWAAPSFADVPAQRDAKQVVILYTHRPVTPICADWDRGIRNALARGYENPIDIEIEYLNFARYQDPAYVDGWIDLLKTKYAGRPPDLIIPVYIPALQFTLEHRASIFPGVPLVFCSVPPQLAERAHAQPNVTGVAFRLDFRGTLAAMKQLLPESRRLVVLSGSSIQEQNFQAAARQELLTLKLEMEFEFVDGLPLGQLLEKLNTADPNTSVLMLSYEQDTNGNHYMTSEITEQLADSCQLPIFGLYDTLLGHGIVGGSLVSAETQGELAGDLAIRVLNGQRPEAIDILGLDRPQLMFDNRQLRRWSVAEADLPANSLVLFREPTFWEEFGNYVLIGAAAFLLQTLIVMGLLVNRSRRIRAESEAQELAGRILTAQEDERRHLAREMHDDLTQRLAASAIAAGNLEHKDHPTLETRDALSALKTGLIAICDDMHRLSRQIHPAILEDFGLEDALRAECDRVEERDGIAVEFRCSDLPDFLAKRTALCLYRIAQEALWNSSKYAHSDRVIVELNTDPEFIHLEVRDFGNGFNPDDVSTKQGLGLASMRERTRLVRGTIDIESRAGDGSQTGRP